MVLSTAPPPQWPAVDRVLGWPGLAGLTQSHGRALVLEAIRAELASRRAAGAACGEQVLLEGIEARVRALVQPSLRKVHNLTGTVLHTNLGRAPLPALALQAIAQVASGASNLEYDLGRGAAW